MHVRFPAVAELISCQKNAKVFVHIDSHPITRVASFVACISAEEEYGRDVGVGIAVTGEGSDASESFVELKHL